MTKQRSNSQEEVTYRITTEPASDDHDAETLKVKICRFKERDPKEWLEWSEQFHDLSDQKD
jgi:hypothetical protein